ncbi:MAG: HPP family protein [Candidatus Micrarchaeia archaeon]
MQAKYVIDIASRQIVGISSKTKIKTAIELMKNTNVGLMPVVDSGKLVGMIDEQLLIEEAKKGIEANYEISTIMKKPFFIAANAKIDEAMDYMVKNKVSRVPVVDSTEGMKCVGIVSATEVLESKLSER